MGMMDRAGELDHQPMRSSLTHHAVNLEPSTLEVQNASSTENALTQSVVDSPASVAIAGKSSAHALGGGSSEAGRGCVPRAENVASRADRMSPTSGRPRSIWHSLSCELELAVRSDP